MNPRTRLVTVAVAAAVLVAGGVAVALILTRQPNRPGPRPVAQHSESPTPTPKPSPGRPRPRPTPTATRSHTTAPSASPPASSPAPTTPPTPPQEDFQQAFALWPRDTPAGARAGCSGANSGWRDRPATVAIRFAAAVLGWKHAQLGDIEGAAGSTYVSVSDGNDDIVLSLTGGYPGAPGGYPGNRCYSVTAVEPPSFVGRDNPLHVHVRGPHARLSFRTLGAASMVVTVAHGSSSRSMIVTEGSAHLDLGSYPSEPGYALVLFRNSDGRDFSAMGVSLPAGNYPTG